jgi:hypothetical protein
MPAALISAVSQATGFYFDGLPLHARLIQQYTEGDTQPE